jgi:hypothetical protein
MHYVWKSQKHANSEYRVWRYNQNANWK